MLAPALIYHAKDQDQAANDACHRYKQAELGSTHPTTWNHSQGEQESFGIEMAAELPCCFSIQTG